MTAKRGGLLAFPGRLTLRVPVPADLLDEADRQAERLGVDQAVMLGDLVARELPDALAEAARDLLAAGTRNEELQRAGPLREPLAVERAAS